METRISDISNDWTQEFTESTTTYCLQNIGIHAVYARFSDLAPNADDKGYLLQPGQGLSSGTHGTGTMHIRTAGKDTVSQVAVTS